jgi:hypothetical protein
VDSRQVSGRVFNFKRELLKIKNKIAPGIK